MNGKFIGSPGLVPISVSFSSEDVRSSFRRFSRFAAAPILMRPISFRMKQMNFRFSRSEVYKRIKIYGVAPYDIRNIFDML